MNIAELLQSHHTNFSTHSATGVQSTDIKNVGCVHVDSAWRLQEGGHCACAWLVRLFWRGAGRLFELLWVVGWSWWRVAECKVKLVVVWRRPATSGRQSLPGLDVLPDRLRQNSVRSWLHRCYRCCQWMCYRPQQCLSSAWERWWCCDCCRWTTGGENQSTRSVFTAFQFTSCHDRCSPDKLKPTRRCCRLWTSWWWSEEW